MPTLDPSPHSAPKAWIDAGLRELIPQFLENLRDDLQQIRALLESGHTAEAALVAHGAKGACMGFGFADAGDMARDLELTLKGDEANALTALDLIALLESYTRSVKVKFF